MVTEDMPAAEGSPFALRQVRVPQVKNLDYKFTLPAHGTGTLLRGCLLPGAGRGLTRCARWSAELPPRVAAAIAKEKERDATAASAARRARRDSIGAGAGAGMATPAAAKSKSKKKGKSSTKKSTKKKKSKKHGKTPTKA